MFDWFLTPDAGWLYEGLIVEAIGTLVEVLIIVALVERVRRRSDDKRLETVREFAWHSITVDHTTDILKPVFDASVFSLPDRPDISVLRPDAGTSDSLKEVIGKAVLAHKENLDRIINAAAVLDKERLDSLSAIHRECDEYLGVICAYLMKEPRDLSTKESHEVAETLRWMIDLAGRLAVRESQQFEAKPLRPKSALIGIVTGKEG